MRLTLKILGAVVALALVGWLAVRDTSPIGHFASAEGRDRFMGAYRTAMAELPVPDATLDLRTSFGVVRMYRFDGPAGPPLLLLPGRASASPMWADNLPSLRRLRTVYTVDLLGEPGASVQDRPIESDADHARWLHEALTGLPEPSVVLVGVSIGGWTATNLALREPANVDGVVLLDPVLTFADLSFGAVVRSIPVSVRWAPRAWRDSFNRWTANGAPVEDEPVADMIESGMRDYVLDLPAPTRISEARLAGLRTPVLAVIAGASVMHDPAEAARTASTTLPNATVLTYDGASHAVNGEQPDRIAADVAAFLDRR